MRSLLSRTAAVGRPTNVIPLNPTQGFAGQKSEKDRVLAFKNTLESNGIPCTVRMRRGIDIQAGCGQLANKNT